MSVLVIIVNFRTPALTVDCLRSLEAEVQAYREAQVVVVDNQSQDGSAAFIAAAIRDEGWSNWVRLVEAPLNGGFAYGNNLVIAPALASDTPPDYLWLLNPDTTIYPGAMTELVAFLQAHPEAGLAGSAIEESHGVVWPYAFRFPSLLSELDDGLKLGIVSRLLSRWSIMRPMDDTAACVDWVAGASLMIKRQVFESVGLMDEGYFLYFEETDFCLQAKRAGWGCWYVPASLVYHIAGQSTGLVDSPPEPRRIPRYWFESRRRFFIKNRSRLYAMATDLVWILSHAVWRVRRLVQRKDGFEPPYVLSDFVRNSSLVTSDIDVNPTVAKARP